MDLSFNRYGAVMNPKTALLHIGTPKTGTTSIQSYLSESDLTGTLLPYRYPMFRHDRDHNRLTTLYLAHKDQPGPRHVMFPRDDNRYQRIRTQYRQFLFQALRSSKGAILSGEALHRFTPSAIIQFREDLESLGFEEFLIVLYIRDPADFYLSLTQSILNLPLQGITAVADPLSFKYRFRQISENYEQVFPGKVIVRCYPRDAQHDVIDDFSGLLEHYLGITVPFHSVRLNTTVSAEAMVVMQDYRQSVGIDKDGLLIPGLDRLVAFLIRSVRRIPQTKPKLKADVAEIIRANHLEDAEFIKARYGVDLGLERSEDTPMISPRPSWRVEDIVESVDPEIVQRLRDMFLRARLRLLLMDVAKGVYRAVRSKFCPR